MKKPELLAPAGDFTRLQYAVQYGADAVYAGGEELSLRTASKNFTREEMQRAVAFCHERNVKIYVACNAVPHNEDMDNLPEYARFLQDVGVDAVILSDLGTFRVFHRESPKLAVHVSTQANVTNYETCNAWYELGARRIVLARELSLDEISDIRRQIPDDLELEAFAHGAMCMSHSGRCLISNYLTGRDSNRGSCTQPCRWKYALCEETRPGQYFPVEETDTGTFIMNSKDLCMIDHIPDMINAGINSLKLEGRVKTEYYVACVTGAYRHAIDACFDDLEMYSERISAYYDEVCKVSHRPYCTGFFYGNLHEDSMNYEDSGYIRDYELIGVIETFDALTKTIVVRQRNKFMVDDVVEIVEADKPSYTFTIKKMYDENGSEIMAAPHAEQIVKIPVDRYVGSMSFLRRKRG